jgi:homocitrate synthase
MSRYVHFASRLTGWNAIKSRVEQLQLEMTDAQVKLVTQKIKALADVRPIAIDDADSIIRAFHFNLHAKDRDERELLPDLTPEEMAKFKKAEMEMEIANEGKGKRTRDEVADEAPAKKTKTAEASA